MKEFLLETIFPFLISWLNQNPNIAPVILILITVQGFFRLVFKPLMTLVLAYVDWTPSVKDNELLQKLFESRGWKIFSFIVDWFLSIKLNPNEKTNKNINNIAASINAKQN